MAQREQRHLGDDAAPMSRCQVAERACDLGSVADCLFMFCLDDAGVVRVKLYELTDVQWWLVGPVFDPKGRRGPRARRSRLTMVVAVLWLARSGCQWRELPPRFGPWPAVWAQWRRWRGMGVWVQAMFRLRRVARVQAGRDPEPSLLMVDAQTVKGRRAGPGFHESGGRGGRARGTKRTLVVDYLGLPVAAVATSARPHDARVGRELLERVLPGQPRVSTVMGDRGYRSMAHRLASVHGVMVEIKYVEAGQGFGPIQPLWKVEDAFAKVGAWRRMSRCFEGTAVAATAWLQVACVGVLLAATR